MLKKGRKKVTTPKIEKVKEQENEELAKLEELKENMGENMPKGYSDADLLSFIRARNLNVKDAEKLVKLDANMKKLILLDSLIKEFDVSAFDRNYHISGVIGCDKEGCQVRVLSLGRCDIKGFVHCLSTIEIFKVFLWFLEHDRMRLEEENKKNGRKITQMSFILDLENLNISNILHKPVLDTGLVALKLLQDHFHDIPKSIFIINAPPLFSSVFKVFKPVIQEHLHKKIKIYGYDGYKEELLKHIDADVLPVYLGGNRVDSNDDPRCKEIIGMGGEIAELYHPDHFLDPEDEEIVTATIPAGSSLSFRFPILEEGTVINYHVQAKDNDVGICVFLDKDTDSTSDKKKDADISKMEQLVPVIRSQCHICPEVGCFVSWFTGTLVLHLDNSYSWMSPKDVYFKVTLQAPNEAPKVLQHTRPEVMAPIGV